MHQSVHLERSFGQRPDILDPREEGEFMKRIIVAAALITVSATSLREYGLHSDENACRFRLRGPHGSAASEFYRRPFLSGTRAKSRI